MSRTPVREALRRLDAEGVGRACPTGAPRRPPGATRTWTRSSGCARCWRSYGASLAATRIGPEALAELAGLADGMERASGRGQLDEVAELNNRFHAGVLAASGNQRLVGLPFGRGRGVAGPADLPPLLARGPGP